MHFYNLKMLKIFTCKGNDAEYKGGDFNSRNERYTVLPPPMDTPPPLEMRDLINSVHVPGDQ